MPKKTIMGNNLAYFAFNDLEYTKKDSINTKLINSGSKKKEIYCHIIKNPVRFLSYIKILKSYLNSLKFKFNPVFFLATGQYEKDKNHIIGYFLTLNLPQFLIKEAGWLILKPISKIQNIFNRYPGKIISFKRRTLMFCVKIQKNLNYNNYLLKSNFL
jgi:hypothetical protein